MSLQTTKPVRTGDQIDLEITSLAFGGDSVGKYLDFAVFVAGGLPGERVRVRIAQVKDHYAVGEILAILRPSTDRVTPTCEIFEECGGCQWQHFNYPQQLKTKRQFVVDSLQRIGHLPNVMVQPCLPSPNPYAYRNKALPVLSMRDGHFISGIYEPRSHHLVPYHSCPIQDDGINDLIQKALKKIDRSGLTPYQEKKHSGFLRHLGVRRGAKTGETLLAFVTRTEIPEERVQKPTLLPEELGEILPRIARELMAEIPGLVGVLQNINPSRTNIVFGPATKTLAGRDHYFEAIDGLRLKVSLKSFLQVNSSQADILHEVVREALGDPAHKKKWGTVLDLYSGIGTLSLAVSGKADYVVGVEEVGAAVEDAKANAELNQKNNIDYLEGDVAKILLGLKEKGLTQIDAAILDPPRKGVLPEVLARVAAFHPERLVYVSCDPSTLARDLALLSKHGFTVDWAQPLDMFPQTYHVETVVKLTRENPIPQDLLDPTGQSQLEPFRLPKPVEPSSLNISANFNALKEKSAELLKVAGQQAAAAGGLVGSIASTLLRGTSQGLAAAGKTVAAAMRPRPRQEETRRAVQQVQNPSASPTSFREGQAPPVPSRTIPTWEGPALEEVNPVHPMDDLTAISPTASAPTETEKLSPLESAFLSSDSDSMEATQEASPEEWVETPPEETLPEALETPAMAAEAVLAEQAEPVPSSTQPQAVSPQVEENRPAAPQPVPAKPLEPTAPLLEAPALPPETPAPRIETPQPKTQWKIPTPSFSVKPLLLWFTGGKKVRWAIALAVLVGGAMIAKATLVPDGKKVNILAPTVSQMIPDVIAVMPTRNFLRYELVPFEVRLGNPKELDSFDEMHATVQVFRSGVPVTMVDGRNQLALKKDRPNGRFLGNWPMPFNPEPGTYVAEVMVSSPQWESPKVFESAFTLSPLKPSGLFPGYAALTMEGGQRLMGGAVPALDGSDSLRAANVVQWAKFMGANVYCYLMGQTSVWDHFNARDFPFNRGDIEVGRKYAKACHEAGIKFAAYMTTFKVVGDSWNQAPYQFSMSYDPDTDEVVQTRFISLEDPKRRQDIVNFLKEMDKDPNVDCVGLDYVRTGDGGYELVDEFVKEMWVPGPANFWALSKQERIHWLAKTVMQKKDREVTALFQWWRAHKVAETLKSILDEAKMSKPVFTFTLGWEMGHEHGQDPAMYVDAGVNYNHIMLYEGDHHTLESMKTQWPAYLSRSNGEYAMGEMVDFNWVQKSLDPPGPEELYDREVEMFHNWFPVNANLGMFWHDLYRIVYGVRGPYSSMEWAISGGKAFTTLKQAEGLLPVEVTLQAPHRAPAGVSVPLKVEIRNNSTQDLKGLVLHQVDTTKNYYTDLAQVGPFDLPAGSIVKVKSLFVNIPKENQPDRDNRTMAAVLLEKPGDSLRAFDFTYLGKSGSQASAASASGDEDSSEESLDHDHR